MKLWEDNNVSVVCIFLSVHRGEAEFHVTITYDALDLTIHGPPGLPPLPWHGYLTIQGPPSPPGHVVQ